MTRILVWAAVAALLLGVTWKHGYITADNERLEKEAQDSRAKVAVVIKTVTKIREVENASLKNLQDDYDSLYAEYLVLHADAAESAKSGRSLSSAADKLQACGPERTSADELPDARRMLADVEGFVLVLLKQGDGEIAKLRRLYERDTSISNAVKP